MGLHKDGDCNSLGVASTIGKSAGVIKSLLSSGSEPKTSVGSLRQGFGLPRKGADSYFRISTFLVLSSTVALNPAGKLLPVSLFFNA